MRRYAVSCFTVINLGEPIHVYYLADQRLKTAAEKYAVGLTLKCRTVYQLYKLYKQGLVTQIVGEKAARILEKECPKDLVELIAPTVD